MKKRVTGARARVRDSVVVEERLQLGVGPAGSASASDHDTNKEERTNLSKTQSWTEL